jgi:hypothetical protein
MRTTRSLRLTVADLDALTHTAAESRVYCVPTNASLAAYEGRGGVHGAARCTVVIGPRDAQEGKEKAQEVHQANAVASAGVAPLVAELRAEGLLLRPIADRLRAEGYTTRRGRGVVPSAGQARARPGRDVTRLGRFT